MLFKLITPFISYKYLLLQLTLREIRARYKQSIIGYFWVILSPLLQLAVYSFVFSVIFRFPTNNIPYSIFLFVGLIPWIFFQTSISSSTLSLIDNSNLIKKVYFPREVFPYAVILSKGVDFLFAFSVLFLLLVISRVQIHLTAIYFLPLLLMQILLATGISFYTSLFNLFYRDIQHLVALLVMLWLYLTPVAYPLSMVPNQYIFFYKLNPMVGIIEGYRSAIFNTPFDTGTIAWSATITFIIFTSGYIFFKRSENIFADIV